MPKKLFELSDEDVAALERLRARRGLRSHVDVVRELIRQADGGDAMATAEPSKPRPSLSHGRGKTVVAPAKREHVSVAAPVLQRKAFNPQPKPGKR